MTENKALPIKGIQIYDLYFYGDNSVMIQEFGQEENDKEFSKIVKLFNKIKRQLDEGNAAPIKSTVLEVQIEFIHD